MSCPTYASLDGFSTHCENRKRGGLAHNSASFSASSKAALSACTLPLTVIRTRPSSASSSSPRVASSGETATENEEEDNSHGGTCVRVTYSVLLFQQTLFSCDNFFVRRSSPLALYHLPTPPHPSPRGGVYCNVVLLLCLVYSYA